MFFGGQKREPARGSRIVPVQTVQAGEAPNTVVSVAITKPGSVVSSPGVMTLSEFQNLMAQGYVSVEEQTEADTAADVQTEGDGKPVAEEGAQAVEADSGELAGETPVEPAEPQAETEEVVSETEEPAVSEATEEFDENGRLFVKSKDGSTTFGEVGEDSGLTAAPIRLSVGVDKVDEDGVHHGYGLAHIEAGHGEQIRNAGYATIEDFVEEVARNYTDIREGSRVAGTQTYLLEVSDKHNNTLFVQLSKNGEYWNVNSAGIFRKKYSRHKQKVSTVPAVGLGTNADVEGVNHGQSEGETVTSGNSPKTFDDKGTEIPSENQVQLPVNPVAEKWNALVKDNEGDEAEALDTAMQMVGNKTAELESARKTVTKGKSEEAIQEAKRAKREKISALETELRFWQDVAAYPEKKRAAEEQAAKLNARMERERKRRESGAVNPNYGLRQTEADERLGAPLSLREYIIRKIATGRVKFLWGASESGTGGLKEHGGVAKRQMLYTDKAKGQYPEDAAEAMRLDIMDNHPELGAVDADAILSEIENLAVGEQTPSEMMDEAERLHERSERFVTDDRQAEDMAPESDGAAEVAAPPVEAETQDGKPRFAGEVFADEDWMKRDDSEEVPFQRVEGAAASPRATERQAKAIARQLKKLGLKGKVRIVDGVAELVKEARARLQSVFHGSPHDFEAFDFSHMGEGEGAQAYGWGGYVTEVEGIGNSYTGQYIYSVLYKGLTRKEIERQYHAGIEKTRNGVILSVISKLVDGYNFKESKEKIELLILQSLNYQIRNNGSYVNEYKQQLAELESLSADDFRVGPGRNLYHVEIPTERDGNYLRWDDEVSDETRDKVLDGLARIEDDTIDAGYFAEQIEKYEADYNLDGQALYQILSRFAFRSDKAASEFLSSLGFVGISYPAEHQSGGRADGARNYVIFKESDMKITDHIRYEQDGNGEIAGATLPNGDVLLNRGAMRVDTPFHEFAHKLFTYAKNNRAASRLYDAIRRYAQNAPQGVKDYVGAHYPGLSEDAYLDEVFAWALSHQSEGGLEAFLQERGLLEDEAAKTWYAQVWDAVKALWAELRPMVSKLMGRDFADLSVFDAYDEMGAEETGKALYDLMMGGKRLPGAVERAVASAEAQTDTNPTEGQKAAGNYRKGHVKVNGFDITIENPKGSERSGVDGTGRAWRQTMHNTYGYIRGTEGVDGDHIDVFLSDTPETGDVFVIDQANPKTGAFDEHKVMMGFDSEDAAREAYLSNYEDGWQGLGHITRVSPELFRKWVESSHRKTKPFTEYKWIGKRDVLAEEADEQVRMRRGEEAEDAGLSDEERGIVERAKADGTYLKAPNGKPTQLSPKQWAQVRTKAFKDWFGDWELATKTVEIVNAFANHGFKNFDEAKEWAEKNIVRTLDNEETGNKGEIRISNNAVKKFLSESSVEKSENKDVHLSVLKVLPKVIRESIDVEQHPDYKKGEDGVRSKENGVNEDVTIHRLYGSVDIDGNTYRVKITLKEDTRNSKLPKGAYSYEATKIELLAGTLGKPDGDAPSTNNSISAAKLLQGVKKSNSDEEILNASKVVDENGEPLVVYHGTERQFSIFRHNPEDIGFHFGNKKIAISRVGRGRESRHMQTYISTKNPLIIDTDLGSWSADFLIGYLLEKGAITKQEAADVLIRDSKLNSIDPLSITANNVRFISDTYRRSDSEANAKMRNLLRAKGYDGIKYSNYYESDGKDSWIVFSPNQIKSATDNVGTFDAGNADIRFRRGEPVEEKGNLVAVHNLSEDKIRQAFDLGGFPMPSIAITKSDIGHTEFGDISLVFDKESINPADRRNKVYGEDAWTPSFPQIGYKLNEEKTGDIYTRANKVGQLPLFRPVSFHPDNYERLIDESGTESLIKKFKDDYSAKQFYLAENGNAVQTYEQREVEKYPADKIALYKEALERIGLERLKNDGYDTLKDDVKQILGRHGIDLDGMQPFRARAWVDSFAKHAVDYAENGNRKIETDHEATQRKIDERVDPQKFEAWLKEMFDGIVEKRGIRNSRDWFTPSGNRRKWEDLFDAITLDNVVNAMQRQNAKGGQGLFGSSIFGAAQEEYKSIEDIRAAARQRLQNISDAETEEARKAITDRLSAINIPGAGDKVSDVFEKIENIQDAVAKSHTAKGIYNYLHDFYPGMTMDIAKELEGIVKDIQKMTGRYFEAKPYRAVGFGEVKLAVVPDNIDKSIIERLKQLNIPVETYEHGNNEQRVQILNGATEKHGLRFRFVGDMFKAAEPRPSSTSANAKRQAAEALSKRLGVPVVIEDGTTPKGRSTRFAGVKGWFVLPNAQNPNGTIHVNVDNHASVEDVERTMLHEVVAHMGMRKMMGEEKYNALLDKVYGSMDEQARAYFEAYAAKDFTRREGMTEEAYHAELRRIAADEYIAALAEVGADPTTWQKVVALVREALRALGFNLSLSDADIRALLYESKHNLESAAYSAERELMRREQKEYRDAAELSNRIEEDERELAREDFTALTAESKAQKRVALESTEPIEVKTGVIKGTDGKRPIDAAIDYMRPQLPEVVKTDVGDIGIDEQSIRSSLSHGFSQKKLDATTSLVEGMRRAVYLGSAKDFDGKDLDNHYFAYPIDYNGERNYVFCRARVDGNTNRMYVHEVFLADEIKEEGRPHQTGALANASQRRGNALYKNILSEILNAKIDNAAESSKGDEVDGVRMRRAGTADDGRLGVISIDADKMGKYDKWSRQGMYRRASAVARYFLDDSLPLRHLMTHIRRSAGGVV